MSINGILIAKTERCPGALGYFEHLNRCKLLTARLEISGFVDDVGGNPDPYLYIYSGDVRVARAQLNGGRAPLSFLKWDERPSLRSDSGEWRPVCFPLGRPKTAEHRHSPKLGVPSVTSIPPSSACSHSCVCRRAIRHLVSILRHWEQHVLFNQGRKFLLMRE